MYHKTTLNNGLRIITAAMPHTRSVSIGVFIGVGSRYESEPQAGISHFIEHLLFKGTDRHPTSREISEAIEGVGGFLNGGTDRELTVYWCKVAKPHFRRAFDLLVDMVLHSRFNPEDIERERQVIIEEIHMSKDSPSQRVDMLIDELLWPGHPLGQDIAGTPESVMAITRDAMLGYLSNHYQPGNTVITIAGDIRHEEVISAVEQSVGNWTNQETRTGYTAYTERQNPGLCIETRDTEQAHLCLALPGLSITDPRRFTLDLLNVILGEGMSSRLFIEIRDKLGLAYSIHSYIEHLLDSGSITVYAGVEPKNLRVAIEAILEQLSGLKMGIPQHELSKAKEMAKGRLLLRMEDSRSVSGWAGGQEILTGQILSVDEVVSLVDAVTTEDITQLAGELLVGSQLRLAVVGPFPPEEPLDRLLKL
ncbi:M16 family metallopeptidase [Chloroflexota bacterium]